MDDFCQVDIAKSGSGAWVTAEAIMHLLGWEVSTKPGKRLPFAKTCDALGVTFSFEKV